MSDVLETKYYKLEKLVKWDKCDEVNKMLLSDISPHQVSAFCKENGFSISHPKLYEYKALLQKAISQQITVERLLGIGVPKRTAIQLQSLGLVAAKDMVKNELEVLDAIIQRGFNALTQNPVIKLADAMKAIELKQKLTGGNHGGLTNFGLEHLRAIETAKFEAMLEVVLQYVPEDKHEELQLAIQNAERSYYEEYAPELLDEYEKALDKQLDEEEENRIQMAEERFDF